MENNAIISQIRRLLYMLDEVLKETKQEFMNMRRIKVSSLSVARADVIV